MRRRRGASAVEFALTLPVLMTLVSAIIDYGWYLAQSITVLNCAREGLRSAAMVSYDDGPDEEAETNTRTLLQAYGIDCATVSCDIDATLDEVAGYDSVTLVVDVGYGAPVGLIPIPEMVHAELTMAVEDQQD
jgi:Flp pilus assembly protein TadG